MKTKMMMVLLTMVSLGAYAQSDKKDNASMAMFKDEKLGSAYEHYLHLKDALVASKSDEAKKAAGELQKSLASLSNGKKAADEVAKIAGTSDLKAQRLAFSNLSNEIASLVKGGKLSSGTLYLEYCPMANNNTGAFWLSNEKQIKNPYFGDMMLTCGSVKETIQ
jgi:hypothetical protein